MLAYDEVYSMDELKQTFGGSKDQLSKEISSERISRSESDDIDRKMSSTPTKFHITYPIAMRGETIVEVDRLDSTDSDTFFDEQRTINTYEQSYNQSAERQSRWKGLDISESSSVFLPIPVDQNSVDIDEKMASDMTTDNQQWMNCDTWMNIEASSTNNENDDNSDYVDYVVPSNIGRAMSSDTDIYLPLPFSSSSSSSESNFPPRFSIREPNNYDPSRETNNYDPDQGDGKSTLVSSRTIDWDPASLAVVERVWGRMAFAVVFVTFVR